MTKICFFLQNSMLGTRIGGSTKYPFEFSRTQLNFNGHLVIPPILVSKIGQTSSYHVLIEFVLTNLNVHVDCI